MISQSVNDIQEYRENQQFPLTWETTHKAFYEQVIIAENPIGDRPQLTKVNDPDPPESRIPDNKAIANGKIHLDDTLNVLGGVA